MPSGWPVFVLVAIFVITWVQWVAGVQGASNELAIGGEGFESPDESVSNIDEGPSASIPAQIDSGGV